ncbi:MAG TPA: efflux RND transporter periplasmic adaptor subunit [Verrucomicrobiae bacterium]
MKAARAILLPLFAFLLFAGIVASVLRHESRTARSETREVRSSQEPSHACINSNQAAECPLCAIERFRKHREDSRSKEGGDLIVLNSNNRSGPRVPAEVAKRRALSRALYVAGKIEASETRRAVLSAPASGYIEFLAGDDATGEIRPRQVLVRIHSAELIQKHAFARAADLFASVYTSASSPTGGATAPYPSIFYAPYGGVIIERAVSRGQHVVTGEKLLTLVDPSVLWFRFDIRQSELSWYHVGQSLDVAVEGVPDKTFPAVISFIEPVLEGATRTVKARAEIQNPVVATNGHAQRLLHLGMLAQGHAQADLEAVLTVPRSAILFAGSAAYVHVDKGGGDYERCRVELGREGDKFREILGGLAEGERVVSSGNLLIDAQAQFHRQSSSIERDSDGG